MKYLLPRASLGPDLVIVSLVMEEEELRDRLVDRHPGQDSVVTMLMVTSATHSHHILTFQLSHFLPFRTSINCAWNRARRKTGLLL